MELISILGIAAGGYVAYKAFSFTFGEPLNKVAERTPNQNYFTDDNTYFDQHLSMNPNGTIKAKIVDPGSLYDIDTGSGVYYRIDQNGLNHLQQSHPCAKLIVSN
jgi:hypothetical protein